MNEKEVWSGLSLSAPSCEDGGRPANWGRRGPHLWRRTWDPCCYAAGLIKTSCWPLRFLAWTAFEQGAVSGLVWTSTGGEWVAVRLMQTLIGIAFSATDRCDSSGLGSHESTWHNGRLKRFFGGQSCLQERTSQSFFLFFIPMPGP